jgi:hypothetical protein
MNRAQRRKLEAEARKNRPAAIVPGDQLVVLDDPKTCLECFQHWIGEVIGRGGPGPLKYDATATASSGFGIDRAYAISADTALYRSANGERYEVVAVRFGDDGDYAALSPECADVIADWFEETIPYLGSQDPDDSPAKRIREAADEVRRSPNPMPNLDVGALERLIRRVSSEAEEAFNFIHKGGERASSLWNVPPDHVHPPTNESEGIKWGNASDKILRMRIAWESNTGAGSLYCVMADKPGHMADVIAKTREVLHKNRAVRFIMAAETWVASKNFDGPASQDPNRTEVVMFYGAVNGVARILEIASGRRIIRPASGPARLGDLEQMDGVWAHALPRDMLPNPTTAPVLH